MVVVIHDDFLTKYTNGLIPRQYFFDINYFELLMGLRSLQKFESSKSIFKILPEKKIPQIETMS